MKNKTKVLTPAQYIIYAFGGVRSASRLLKKSPSTISRWAKRPTPKNQRGNGGRVPANCQRQILDIATRFGIDVTPEDLIYGRRIET